LSTLTKVLITTKQSFYITLCGDRQETEESKRVNRKSLAYL